MLKTKQLLIAVGLRVAPCFRAIDKGGDGVTAVTPSFLNGGMNSREAVSFRLKVFHAIALCYTPGLCTAYIKFENAPAIESFLGEQTLIYFLTSHHNLHYK